MKILRVAKGERYDAPIVYVVERGEDYDVIENPFEAGEIRKTGEVLKAADACIQAPCVPSKVLCCNANYHDQGNEMAYELPTEVTFFFKPPSAITAQGEVIVYPRQTQRVTSEVELAIVIGKRAKNVMPEEAMDYILGYTIVNDVTATDLLKRDEHWTRSKGFDTFCPMGPCIVTDMDWRGLQMTSSVNGQLFQDANTEGMIFPPNELISSLSKIMTLMPGDIIATGTPAGGAEMNRGDVVEVFIQGIGVLRNRVN
jgi:2-keto-4-pentenoate hydratase/2-oxohepta-3-ene-1,7-dioic acid hydratase (catechol pathway)